MATPPEAHCRVGQVRWKHSPHLAAVVPEIRGMNYREDAHRFIDKIFGYYEKEGVAAVVVMAIGFDGCYSSGTRIHKDAPFGSKMLPMIVAEYLRCNNIEDIAKEVYHGNI